MLVDDGDFHPMGPESVKKSKQIQDSEKTWTQAKHKQLSLAWNLKANHL